MNKRLLLLLIFAYQLHAAHFGPLTLHASTLPEFPASDNGDWEHPIFNLQYARERANQSFSFLYNNGFAHKIITASDVVRLINYLNSTGTLQDYVGGIVTLNAHNDAQYVIFGDLQGAFHSLMRDLGQLISMGILTENFKLASEAYLIFNGNVLGNSPYNMQTLYIVLQLMMLNPGKVLYVQGAQEKQWPNASSQLYQQLSALHVNVKELEQFSYFFDKLPHQIYIRDGNKGIVIDGGVAVSRSDIMEFVASIVPNYEHKTVGLRRYVGPPTKWALFSSPTGANRRLHAFLYDAFALVRTQQDVANWTITFYHNDAREKTDFKEPSTYNLVIGNLMHGPALPLYDTADIERLKAEVTQLEARVQELTELCLFHEKQQAEQVSQVPGKLLAIHDQNIVFGCTLDLVKSVRNQSKSLQEGLLAKIHEINESGGLRGKQMQIIFLDDAYTPVKARENVNRFIDEFKTDLLLCPIGTPTLEYYLDLVKAGKLLVLFPLTGSLLFKQPDLEYIVQFRPSYADELAALTEHVITKYHAKKFLIFYQKDSYGTMHKDAVKQLLKTYNIQQYQEFFYERNDLNFTPRLQEIRDFNPDTIIFISTATAAQSLIRQMGAGYFVDKHLYGTSNNFGEAGFKNFMKVKGLSFFVAHVVPNPEMSNIEIAQEFRTKAAQTNMIINTVSFEGYIMASLTEYIFNQFKGTLSKENIIDFVHTIKDLNFKGLQLDFNQSLHRLSHKLWISESNDPNWIEVDLLQASTQQE